MADCQRQPLDTSQSCTLRAACFTHWLTAMECNGRTQSLGLLHLSLIEILCRPRGLTCGGGEVAHEGGVVVGVGELLLDAPLPGHLHQVDADTVRHHLRVWMLSLLLSSSQITDHHPRGSCILALNVSLSGAEFKCMLVDKNSNICEVLALQEELAEAGLAPARQPQAV